MAFQEAPCLALLLFHRADDTFGHVKKTLAISWLMRLCAYAPTYGRRGLPMYQYAVALDLQAVSCD
jgi:hypothetical protein